MHFLKTDFLHRLHRNSAISHASSSLTERFHFAIREDKTLLEITNMVGKSFMQWKADITKEVLGATFFDRYTFVDNPEDSLFPNWKMEKVLKQLPKEVLVVAENCRDHFYVVLQLELEKVGAGNPRYPFTLYRERIS